MKISESFLFLGITIGLSKEKLSMLMKKHRLCRSVLFGFLLSITLTGCKSGETEEVSSSFASSEPGFLTNLASVEDYKLLEGIVKDSSGRTIGKYVKYAQGQKIGSTTLYFQNTKKYAYHHHFFKAEISELSQMTISEYNERIYLLEGERAINAGALTYLPDYPVSSSTSVDVISFTVYVNPEDLAKRSNAPSIVKKIKQAYDELKNRVPTSTELRYLVSSTRELITLKRELETQNIPFIRLTASNNQVYNPATSYGYLKILSGTEVEKGEYTEKDILVLETVPLDIGPVSGVITAEPQVPHSHVILRTINQNVPNVYLRAALSDQQVQTFLGQLVELKVEDSGKITIRDRGQLTDIDSRAQAYWTSRKPNLPDPIFDLSVQDILRWTDAPVTRKDVAAYGSKGVNFAILDGALSSAGTDRSLFQGGFLLPFSAYESHTSQTLTSSVCEKALIGCRKLPATLCAEPKKLCDSVSSQSGSIKEFIGTMLSSENAGLKKDLEKRRAWLEFTRRMIRHASLSEALLSRVTSQIERSYPPHIRIRFRSSTNAEDLPGLNGAGLYRSASGCLIDSGLNPPAASAPSGCTTATELARTKELIRLLRGKPEAEAIVADLTDDLTDKDEIKDAIRKVFASLWNDKAYLNREYYGIDHRQVYMGILVHPSFVDEKANGVVISENGSLDIVAQKDDISVTNPEIPGARPERIEYSENGAIIYKKASSLVPEGQRVLQQAHVKNLAEQIKVITSKLIQVYGPSYGPKFDVEFKMDSGDNIVIKQIRPL